MPTDSFILDRMPSPIGTVLLICDQAGNLCMLDFDEYEPRMLGLLRRFYGKGAALAPRKAPHVIINAVAAYFAGEVGAIDKIAVQMGGTPFQREVWSELRRIPAGATTSYGALARTIGRPTAFRAVGHANGANPVGVVVPCHRVIGTDASLTGYGGGLERKRWLLDHERKWAGAKDLLSTKR